MNFSIVVDWWTGWIAGRDGGIVSGCKVTHVARRDFRSHVSG